MFTHPGALDKSLDDHINEIDSHIKHHEENPKDHTAAKADMSPEALKSFDVCTTYNIARPALHFVAKYLLFWKPKWVTAINKFFDTLDGMCPQ